jgi:hypothetical protein
MLVQSVFDGVRFKPCRNSKVRLLSFSCRWIITHLHATLPEKYRPVIQRPNGVFRPVTTRCSNRLPSEEERVLRKILGYKEICMKGLKRLTFEGLATNRSRRLILCAVAYEIWPAERIIALQHNLRQDSFLISPSLRLFHAGVEAHSGVCSIVPSQFAPRASDVQEQPVRGDKRALS